ncbi:Phage-related protein (PblB) [Fructobacillus evanidus]|uniref:Phage-related protein (PblB) n=1 Tax=Fructobacillus evanidus TaxID=3064281 RepID=A0ABM9N1Z3_9LACO|nr:Phage-related protein (PblB) [Fructobacillus sp. LMG 32999]CAK1248475.1 Phage-related protein (PblB) [Fructobacillus sp. LMG 32999]CAK1249284.1 Phage-related protein (PblB) [Fructobacillus sp. LMG 32999]CAK1254390.1 Phage-related protein (PblB) [Fructobacillus sp. LMG 32999]CAK1255173.1 Phage-related protein (PblB) [Fructobacillus sp. LMG 32999]
MYRVIVYKNANDQVGEVLHEPRNYGNKAISGELDMQFNGISTASFTITMQNSLYRQSEAIANLVKVVDTNTGKVVFDGRVVKIDGSFSGSHTQVLQCEDCLAFLHDSTQVYRKVQDTTIRDFLQMIVDEHNRQVEPYKRFQLGRVTVTNSTDNVYRYTDDAQDTFDTIKDKLVSRLGGFLIWHRDGNGQLVLEYLASVGEHIDTPIKLGKNLKSAKREYDVRDIITRLVPIGSPIEQENTQQSSDDTAAAQPKTTIESVNNGIRYLDDTALIGRFGIIQKAVEWTNVKVPSILKSKGQEYLQNQRVGLLTWSVDVVDISLLDPTYKSFEMGNFYPIYDQFLGLVEDLQVVAKKLDITQPHKMSLTIGTKNRTLSQYQLDYQAAMQYAQQQRQNAQQTANDLKNRIKELLEATNRIPEQDKEIADLQARLKELESQQSQFFDGAIVDVSEFQGDIDWNKVNSAGLALAIVRVQYGANRADLKYQRNLSALGNLGANYAVYSYMTASDTASAENEAQALYTRTQQASNGKQPRFYMIDVEETTGSNMCGIVEAYMNKLNSLGVPDSKIVLYIANQLYNSFNLNVSRAGSIMIPAYRSTPPDHAYDLWQYTSSGSVIGINGNVDMSKNYSDRFKNQYLRKE